MLVKPNYPAESPVVHPSFTTDPTGDPPTGGNRITMHAHDVLWFRGKPGQSASSSPVKMQVTSAYVVRVCDEVSWNGVFGTVS